MNVFPLITNCLKMEILLSYAVFNLVHILIFGTGLIKPIISDSFLVRK